MAMKTTSTFFFFVASLLVALATASVEETCKNAAASSRNINYDFCVASLQADPGSRTANPQGLAVIAGNLAVAKATSTTSKIEVLLKNPTNPAVKSALEDCRSQYQDALGNLKGAVNAVKSNQLGDAKTWFSAGMDGPTTCEDGFGEVNVQSPLKKEDGDLFELVAIALAITNTL